MITIVTNTAIYRHFGIFLFLYPYEFQPKNNAFQFVCNQLTFPNFKKDYFLVNNAKKPHLDLLFQKQTLKRHSNTRTHNSSPLLKTGIHYFFFG